MVKLAVFNQIWHTYAFNRRISMAKKGAREKVKLKSTEGTEVYWTMKSKRNTPDRMELKKYDKRLKRHVVFKEAK